jgi:hypothetical protein
MKLCYVKKLEFQVAQRGSSLFLFSFDGRLLLLKELVILVRHQEFGSNYAR